MSIPGLGLAYPPEPLPAFQKSSIEELATEPSVPVGEELPESSYPDDDQNMEAVSQADTESSYDPPDVPEIDPSQLRGGDTMAEETTEHTTPAQRDTAVIVDEPSASTVDAQLPRRLSYETTTPPEIPPSSDAQTGAEIHDSNLERAQAVVADEAARRASEAQDAEDAAASLLAMASTPRTATPVPRTGSAQGQGSADLEDDILGSLEQDLHRLHDESQTA